MPALTRPRAKKVMAFLWNGVWSRDRTGLPMNGVKKKFIQKNRDILPALCNDILYLIGKEVRGIREGIREARVKNLAYHERQYRIYRGLEVMPFNCVEHGAVVLHKKVWTRTKTDDFKLLRRICDDHEDNGHRRWCRRRCAAVGNWTGQYVAHVTDLITRHKRGRPGDGLAAPPCPWETGGAARFKVLLEEGNLEWGGQLWGGE